MKVMLESLDDQLDTMLSEWIQALLTNLQDPTSQGNMELLKPSAKELLDGFIEQGELPEELSPEFIKPLQEVLSGLVKVSVTIDELRQALLKGGK